MQLYLLIRLDIKEWRHNTFCVYIIHRVLYKLTLIKQKSFKYGKIELLPLPQHRNKNYGVFFYNKENRKEDFHVYKLSFISFESINI